MSAAVNARDADALAEVFHPDAELWPVSEFLPAGTSYHGRDGLATLLKQVLASLPEVRSELLAFHDLPDRVAATFRLSVAGLPERESHWVFGFQDDRILRAEQFATAQSAFAAAERHVLTPRERQVLQLLAHGLNGPEIAEKLVLSPETVRTHVQNAVDRLGAATRVQAVAMAIASGEIEA